MCKPTTGLIVLCPKLTEFNTWFFSFLNFNASNASFTVVFSLNELNNYHFVLISCYLRVLFKIAFKVQKTQTRLKWRWSVTIFEIQLCVSTTFFEYNVFLFRINFGITNLLKHYKKLRNDESRKKGSLLPAAPARLSWIFSNNWRVYFYFYFIE